MGLESRRKTIQVESLRRTEKKAALRVNEIEFSELEIMASLEGFPLTLCAVISGVASAVCEH